MHVWICEQAFVKDRHRDSSRLKSEQHEPLLPSPRSISLVFTLKRVCLESFRGATLAMPSTIWWLQALHGITRAEPPGRDMLESATCDLISSPNFYLPEGGIFHLKTP